MKKILTLTALSLILVGCVTKNRSVELAGMYISDTGSIAIGDIELTASPTGEEAAFFKYWEDSSWLNPANRTKNARLNLSGTNTCQRLDAALEQIRYMLDANSTTNSVAN